MASNWKRPHPKGLLPWQSPSKDLAGDETGAGGDFQKIRSNRFGTAVCPSPLDRIRCFRERLLRGQDLGLSPACILPSSFEGNQSLPCSRYSRRDVSTSRIVSLAAVDENSFSFGVRVGVAGRTEASRRSAADGAVLNPNKGVITMSSDGKISVVSDVACRILCYAPSVLVGLNLYDLLVHREDLEALAELELLSPTDSVLVSGKVVEVLRGDGSCVCVSLWLRQQERESALLAVLEPVERSKERYADAKGTFTILATRDGTIVSMDVGAEDIFQWEETVAKGKSISLLVPQIPEEVFSCVNGEMKLRLAGRTKDGMAFPLSIRSSKLKESGDEDTQQHECATHRVTVWVYSNISGLVVLNGMGIIESCNSSFTKLLLGYTDQDLKGKSVTNILPGFYEEIELLDSFLSNTGDDDDLGCRHLSISQDDLLDREEDADVPVEVDFDETEDKENRRPSDSSPSKELKHVTSTPARLSEKRFYVPEGSFFGYAKHRDGTELNVLYQIKRVSAPESAGDTYCLWISRDPDEPAEGRALATTFTKSCHEVSLGNDIVQQAMRNPAQSESVLMTAGTFAESYCSLQEIGKGAFGFVRMAYRKADKKLFVIKFINKGKMCDDNIIADETGRRLPVEIHFLQRLRHPNIVGMCDFFENDHYYQMVMEKHGFGMDLFEFIDRGPVMDEELSSYIFRQVVNAVAFMHSCGVLHRDIKDENVIINERFEVKLIDFGSAAVHRPGTRMHTFYGTIEYCSPEVLEGNPYEGPELEVWSLGVLLYIIVFWENPFFNIEETIRCRLLLPHHVSPGCANLIKSILVKDPKQRLSLQQVCDDSWLRQDVDPTKYNFQDIVRCSEEELHPVEYFSTGTALGQELGQVEVPRRPTNNSSIRKLSMQ